MNIKINCVGVRRPEPKISAAIVVHVCPRSWEESILCSGRKGLSGALPAKRRWINETDRRHRRQMSSAKRAQFHIIFALLTKTNRSRPLRIPFSVYSRQISYTLWFDKTHETVLIFLREKTEREWKRGGGAERETVTMCRCLRHFKACNKIHFILFCIKLKSFSCSTNFFYRFCVYTALVQTNY